MKKTYKLLKLRDDGTIGPLFINKAQVIPVGEWIEAEDHPTKGYAHRPGWHTCDDTVAPHLKMNGRIWCEVVIDSFIELKRPESQGAKWYLSKYMKIVKLMDDVRHINRFDNPE
jgi:hypothetical protein